MCIWSRSEWRACESERGGDEDLAAILNSACGAFVHHSNLLQRNDTMEWMNIQGRFTSKPKRLPACMEDFLLLTQSTYILAWSRFDGTPFYNDIRKKSGHFCHVGIQFAWQAKMFAALNSETNFQWQKVNILSITIFCCHPFQLFPLPLPTEWALHWRNPES